VKTDHTGRRMASVRAGRNRAGEQATRHLEQCVRPTRTRQDHRHLRDREVQLVWRPGPPPSSGPVHASSRRSPEQQPGTDHPAQRPPRGPPAAGHRPITARCRRRLSRPGHDVTHRAGVRAKLASKLPSNAASAPDHSTAGCPRRSCARSCGSADPVPQDRAISSASSWPARRSRPSRRTRRRRGDHGTATVTGTFDSPSMPRSGWSARTRRRRTPARPSSRISPTSLIAR